MRLFDFVRLLFPRNFDKKRRNASRLGIVLGLARSCRKMIWSVITLPKFTVSYIVGKIWKLRSGKMCAVSGKNDGIRGPGQNDGTSLGQMVARKAVLNGENARFSVQMNVFCWKVTVFDGDILDKVHKNKRAFFEILLIVDFGQLW